MELIDLFFLMVDATIRVSVPLILAALAGIFSERSGIVDIGLEGKMLAAAFAAAACAHVTQSPWIGLLGGMFAAMMFAIIHGFACISRGGNQIVSGVAINVIVAGITVVLGSNWFSQGGRTPQLPPEARFSTITLPGAEAVADIPIIGNLYSEVLSGHNFLVYLAFAIVPFAWWLLFQTRFGLRLRAVGENPKAADTAGLSVAWLRYRAVLICGALCGMAGTYLSTAQGAAFVKDMSAGKGYIALAAMIFGKWRPVPAMFACLLFGFLEAVAVRSQGIEFPLVGQIPVQLVEALPYILTVILLAGFIGKAIAPKASGIPYVKER